MKDTDIRFSEPYLLPPKQRRQASTQRANAKIEKVRDQVREIALAQEPGTQLATIRELCAMLKTSSATLTAALDLLESEHVIQRKERQGIFVSPTIHQRMIHIFFNISYIADVSNSPFWSLLLVNLIEEAEKRMVFKNEQFQFHFLLSASQQKLPMSYVELLHSQKADMCILIGFDTHYAEKTSVLHIPHVSYAGISDITVYTDSIETISLAEKVLEQRGCKHIAYWVAIRPDFNAPVSRYSTSVSSQSLEENVKHHWCTIRGVPLQQLRYASLPPVTGRAPYTYQEQGYLLAKEVFGANSTNRPDGIFILDDMMTAGALTAWEEMGIRVGRDIQVVSHATTGSPVLFGKVPPLITIEYDPADVVRAMFIQVDEVMAKPYTPAEKKIVIKSRLS